MNVGRENQGSTLVFTNPTRYHILEGFMLQEEFVSRMQCES